MVDGVNVQERWREYPVDAVSLMFGFWVDADGILSRYGVCLDAVYEYRNQGRAECELLLPEPD